MHLKALKRQFNSQVSQATPEADGWRSQSQTGNSYANVVLVRLDRGNSKRSGRAGTLLDRATGYRQWVAWRGDLVSARWTR